MKKLFFLNAMRPIWIVFFAITITACAGPRRQPVEMQTKFDYEMHKPYMQKGNNTIKGQGFLRQQGGGVVTCAGSEVLLLPATPFFRESINILRTGKKPISEKLDPASKTMIKRSQGDAQGNFTFNEVPDGDWFVVTQVKWMVGYRPQGGSLLKEISVAKGETKEVLLTDRDLVGW